MDCVMETLIRSMLLESLKSADYDQLCVVLFSCICPTSLQLGMHPFSFPPPPEAGHFPYSPSVSFVLTSHYKPHGKEFSKFLAIRWILLCLGISSAKQIRSSFVNSALLRFPNRREHSPVLLSDCTVSWLQFLLESMFAPQTPWTQSFLSFYLHSGLPHPCQDGMLNCSLLS